MSATGPAPGDVRPDLHLTPRHGWINDPLGLTFHDGLYHLFFQHVPDSAEWAPGCHWGHATSPDLLHWSEQEPALVPGDGDDGCWSGCLVRPGEGAPVLFYTAVTVPDVAIGTVRTARPVDSAWRVWGKGPVVVRVPTGVRAVAFRDPFVFREGGRWRMLVGAGLEDGTATALHYSSPDLASWTYDGPLATRSTVETEPVWTGSLWECPQLFPLGDRHVLVVSVWDDDRLHHVAYALGSYRDGRFVADTWARLSHGPSCYAASAFLDAGGDRGLICWLRGVADPTGRWTGALSLPYALDVDGDRLRVRPHPVVAARRRPAPVPGKRSLDIEWAPPGARPSTLRLLAGEGPPVAELAAAGGWLTLTAGGTWSMPHGSGPVRVVVDGPVVEVFADGGVLAAPLGAARSGITPVTQPRARLRWWPLGP